MLILICDDDALIIEQLQQYIKIFFDKKTVLTALLFRLKKIMPVYWRNLEDE